ncbi:hypothetical protein GHT07_09055 [Caenimonas koreensis DSM 17982]|uniref:DUF2268 domain-containing protein n=1 Tax=Caenimonas koreensis DSM 17982 TaxID=1121255 RepID=A0A844ATJ0_9BURK|nr:DUF2268 domain-containing putative Zn-dependent protease [Caenimonas koreensis]MRD47424.1 hypothetical protein [Caenimonas koreensis DSM 17982]
MLKIARSLFTALALVAACMAHAADPTYRVINTMPDYWKYEAAAKGLDANAQLKLFRELVIERYPEIYTARVIGLDETKPVDVELAKRFVRTQRMMGDKTAQIRAVSDSIAADLPRYEAKFRQTFPDLDFRGNIYFMHTLGGFDGGTRKIDGKTTLLFGVDMIGYVYGADVDPQPFFHHELFHLYHDQFKGNGAHSTLFAGALWREGLATYVAQALNPQASGVSIFALPKSTPDRVKADLPRIARDMRQLLDSRDKKDYQRYFTGARENGEPPQRAGYYVGYLIASKLGKTHTLQELAKMPFAQVRVKIEKALEEMEAGR